MDVKTIESSQRRSATSERGSTIVAAARLINAQGAVLHEWGISDSECSIGSAPGNFIRLTDSNVRPVHATLIAGKRRLLVRGVGGLLRAGYRDFAETLIDEPTIFQFGAVRLLIVPPDHINDNEYRQHRVTAGSVAEQAARLREPVPPTPLTSAPGRTASLQQEPAAAEPVASPITVTGPEAILEKIELLTTQTFIRSLEPLEKSVTRTQQSLEELANKLDALNRVPPEAPAPTSSLATLQLENRVTERIDHLAKACDSLGQNLTTSIESGLAQIASFLSQNPSSEAAETEKIATEVAERVVAQLAANLAQPIPAQPNFIEANQVPPSALTASQQTLVQQEPGLDQSSNLHVESNPYATSSLDSIPYQWADHDAQQEISPSSIEEPTRSAGAANLLHWESNDDIAIAPSLDETNYAESVDPASQPALPAWFTSESDNDQIDIPSQDNWGVPASWYGEDAPIQDDSHVSTSSEENLEVASEPTAAASSHEIPEDVREVMSVPIRQQTADPDAADYSSWSSASLNPIYAEDTSQWVQSDDEFTDQASSNNVDDQEDERLSQVSWFNPANGAPSEAESFEESDETDSHRFERPSYADDFDVQPEVEESDYASVDSPTQEFADDESPVEEIDVYSAFKHQMMESGDDAEIADELPINTIVKQKLQSQDEPEESIEDYMARLLARVKGEPDESLSPVRPKAPSIRPTLQPQVSFNDNVASPDNTESYSNNAIANTSGVDAPSPSIPAVVRYSGERSEDRAALRELANQTARSAIQRSSKKRLEYGIFMKVSIALMGLIGGLVLLFLNGFHANIAMVGMICCFIVCLLWGYEASVQARSLLKSNGKESESNGAKGAQAG